MIWNEMHSCQPGYTVLPSEAGSTASLAEAIDRRGLACTPKRSREMASALQQLLGASVIDGSGQTVAVSSLAGDDKVLGLYFSAHWCPPCRGFTPELAKFYKQMKEKVGDKLEIVFISSDRGESDWKGYFAEMPWLALPFSARDLKEKLGEKYGVTGIPTLVILDASSGETISLEGRRLVMTDPDGFPWK